MKVIIEIPDKDPERVLNYFYQICLDNPELKEFKVSIEGTDLERKKR